MITAGRVPASASETLAWLVEVDEEVSVEPRNVKLKIILMKYFYIYLDSIVDEPLKSSQCSDHDDPRSESSPHSLKT